jgi:DNA-binding GntR family transcriptional regulator
MTQPSKPHRSANLTKSVIDEVKRLIYTGEVKPGDRLNEAALATRLGTSRGPVREALKGLAGQGLVTAVPNRGMFVRQLSFRDMLEVYELRALMFGYAAARACDHFSEEHRADFEGLLKAMDEACEADQGTRYYELNLAFHAKILALSNNRHAQQAYDEYVKQLHIFRRQFFNVPGNMRRSNVEHREIFEAIAVADVPRARTAAEQHVLAGRSRLLTSFDQPIGP